MANGNPWFTGGVQQSLEQYVPAPFQELSQVGQVIQNRYDTNIGQLEDTAVGLSSIEAIAPAHREYINQFAGGYRQEADSLLEKYNNRADDPQFARELRRLTSKYANDPNLRTVMQANEQYRQKLKTRQELDQKGVRYIDSNPNFTGVDESGNLVSDTGSIRATVFDENLRQAFQDTQKAMINTGQGVETNKMALDSLMQSIQQGGINNPDIREGLQYYTSQGMSIDEAQSQLQNDLQSLYTSNLIQDVDWGLDASRRGWANLDIAQQRLAMDKMTFLQKQEAASGFLVPIQSPLIAKDLNRNLIRDVDMVMGNKEGATDIPDTPENRSKYPNAKPRSKASGIIESGNLGVGMPKYESVLEVPINTKRQEIVSTARDVLGDSVEGYSDDRIINTYKEYLESDSNAPIFWGTPNGKNKAVLENIYFGPDGKSGLGDAIIVDHRGKKTRVADGQFDLDKVKGTNFTGVTTSPLNDYGEQFDNGAITGTATVDGKLVRIYKPQDMNIASRTRVSNMADRAILSDMTNTQLLKDPRFRVEKDGIIIAPQKTKNRTINFYQINPDTGERIGNPIDAQEIRQEEFSNIGSYYSGFTK